MADFATMYVGKLRQMLDAQTQLSLALPAITASIEHDTFTHELKQMMSRADFQSDRIAKILELLYLPAEGSVCWACAAMLRQAADAARLSDRNAYGVQDCAAALLSLERYVASEYETLLRWSYQCALDEALGPLRRCLAEAMLQGAILSEFAFQPGDMDVVKCEQVEDRIH